MYKLSSYFLLPAVLASSIIINALWLLHHSLQQDRNCAFHTCGRQVFVLSAFTAFISVHCVPAGSAANQRDDTVTLQILMSCQYHCPAPCLLLSSSLAASVLYQVICLLTCSFSLINSIIKDSTSKPQLQGLPVLTETEGGNKPGAVFLSSSSTLCLLLLINSSAYIISCSCSGVLV